MRQSALILIIIFKMSTGELDRLLIREFKKSFIYIFYEFLKKPEAFEVVNILDQKQSKFSFFPRNLFLACPSLNHYHSFNILRSQGMDMERMRWKSGRFWEVSHRTLTNQSSKQEIMNVWLKAEVQNFIRTDNVVSQLYRKLKYTNEAHWNDDGTVVEIQDTSDLMLLQPKLRQFGFYRFEDGQPAHQNSFRCFNASLNRHSFAKSWFAVYLKYKNNQLKQSTPLKMIEAIGQLKCKQANQSPEGKGTATEIFYHEIVDEETQTASKETQISPFFQIKAPSIRLLIKDLIKETKAELAKLQVKHMELDLGVIFILCEHIQQESKPKSVPRFLIKQKRTKFNLIDPHTRRIARKNDSVNHQDG